MASSFRRLRGLPGAELEARSSSPHCALPRNGGSGLVPPRTPHRPPQAASSQLAEGLEASSELRLASLLQLVNPASRTASPTPGPTQEKMPGPEMLEASSNAEGETDDAPAQVAAPLSDAHAQQQHARQVEALVRALRKKPVASTGQCSRRASGDYASADTATLPSCGSKTSENGVQGPETAPTIARHAAAAADEAAEAEEEVEGGVETEEAAVVGRLDNLFATLNRCRASLDAQVSGCRRGRWRGLPARDGQWGKGEGGASVGCIAGRWESFGAMTAEETMPRAVSCPRSNSAVLASCVRLRVRCARPRVHACNARRWPSLEVAPVFFTLSMAATVHVLVHVRVVHWARVVHWVGEKGREKVAAKRCSVGDSKRTKHEWRRIDKTRKA
eukprot:6176936-Pleurochrysis_carterae.AAC.1